MIPMFSAIERAYNTWIQNRERIIKNIREKKNRETVGSELEFQLEELELHLRLGHINQEEYEEKKEKLLEEKNT